MEQYLEQFWALTDQAEGLGRSLLVPWRFYQILILIALFGAAHLLTKWLTPSIERWMRNLEGMKAWQLRTLIVVVRRLRGMIFVLLAWITYLVMQEVTWPSRSYMIGLIATLATAWVFVAVSTRLIRNKAIRKIVRWGAWIFATIQILDFNNRATEVLDQIAFSMGDTRVSMLLVIQAIATLGLLLAIATWTSRLTRNRLESNEDLSPSLRVLTDKIITVILFGVAVVIGLQIIGFDLTSLTVLSGAIGLGIGFGLQKVVSNLISGVIVLLDKSIKPGDVISLGDTFGWVSDLNARFVGVNTRDGREFLIPNEDLITSQVVNWSHSSDLIRLDIYFGVSYASDPHEVRKLAREAAGTVKRVVNQPPAVCHIVGFGDSSIDFILRFWIRDPSSGLTNVRGDVYLALWDTLKANDIEIPFPRRDVTILSDDENDIGGKLIEG